MCERKNKETKYNSWLHGNFNETPFDRKQKKMF